MDVPRTWLPTPASYCLGHWLVEVVFSDPLFRVLDQGTVVEVWLR